MFWIYKKYKFWITLGILFPYLPIKKNVAIGEKTNRNIIPILWDRRHTNISSVRNGNYPHHLSQRLPIRSRSGFLLAV